MHPSFQRFESLPSFAGPLYIRSGALVPLNRICLSITAALAISSFASIASPSRVSAETASIQDALEEEVLEQVAVAFAMMKWLPRLEGACDLYKKGFFLSLNCQRLIALSTKVM